MWDERYCGLCPRYAHCVRHRLWALLGVRMHTQVKCYLQRASRGLCTWCTAAMPCEGKATLKRGMSARVELRCLSLRYFGARSSTDVE